jgi:hypothetical protein
MCQSQLRPHRHNSGANSAVGAAGTFKPYDPSKVQGDTTPNLPAPQAEDSGCGGIGQILVIIVAIVVTVVTYGAAAAYFGPGLGATIAAGAVAWAAGSIASQAVGIAIGVQQDFDWKGVALAAVGGAIGGGLSEFSAFSGAANSTANVVVRAAIGNALTQGVAVATGLQAKFDWKGVAIAAVGAGVGSAVSEGLGDSVRTDDAGNAFLDKNGNFERLAGTGPLSALGRAGAIIRSSLSGAAAGITTASLRGGKIDIARIATDAFGNALGSSWSEQINASVQEGKLAQVNSENQREANRFASAGMANVDNLPGGANQMGALDQDELLGSGALRSRGLAAPSMQEQSDALYGFSNDKSGLGFKAFGSTGLRYGGVTQTQAPDDTRVVRDFDPENQWDPEAPGPTGGQKEHLVAQVGLLINPATTGGAVGGGYRPIRPAGAGGPPGYDIRTDMPTDIPGYKQADPGLGLGAPVKPNDGPS